MAEGHEVHALTMTYSDPAYRSVEVEYAQAFAERMGIRHVRIDLSTFTVMFTGPAEDFAFRNGDNKSKCHGRNDIVAPGSNELLHVVAASYALMHGMEAIFWALHADDIDTTFDRPTLKAYLQHIEEAVRLMSGGKVRFELPFLNITKAQIVALGISLGVDVENETYSCSYGESQPCGTCPQCVLRQKALAESKVPA